MAPIITAIFPAGLKRVGIEFHGWKLVNQLSLDILDKMVKVASHHEFQVLTTTKIKKNKELVNHAQAVNISQIQGKLVVMSVE